MWKKVLKSFTFQSLWRCCIVELTFTYCVKFFVLNRLKLNCQLNTRHFFFWKTCVEENICIAQRSEFNLLNIFHAVAFRLQCSDSLLLPHTHSKVAWPLALNMWWPTTWTWSDYYRLKGGGRSVPSRFLCHGTASTTETVSSSTWARSGSQSSTQELDAQLSLAQLNFWCASYHLSFRRHDITE